MSFVSLFFWVSLAQAGVKRRVLRRRLHLRGLNCSLFIFIFLIMYALIIRPQQKKAKEHDALLKKLKIGDKVSTASGIVGVITQIKQNSVSLRSADSKLEMLLPSVDRVLKEKDSPEA